MFNSLETVFKHENIDLLFRTERYKGTFIAETNNSFSGYMKRKDFSREWALSFPAGRYVITVYQRYSVYQEGNRVWRNEDYLNEVGHDSRYRSPSFVIILDCEMNSEIPSWDRPLCSNTVRNKENPLQAQTFSSIEKAEMAAQKYSEQRFKAAVLEWFEDYDMY